MMLEDVYSCPQATERARNSWLKPFIESYFQELETQNIKKRTLKFYANQLLCFGRFLEQQGIQDITRLPECIEPFVRECHPEKPAFTNWRSVLSCFARHLMRQGVIPMPEPMAPAYPHADVIREYLGFLREHRGVSDKHVQRTQHCCVSFMTFLATHDVADLTSIPPQLIHRFIVQEGSHYHRVTMSTRCGALRRFLRHLYRRSVTPVDLSSVVVAPVVYQQEQCPRFLTRAEIEAVLAVVDQESPRGRRDYAMVLLLAVYGLRGIEVIRLRLDDIDWRNQKLHVGKRKAGNRTTYPLSVPVGEAIVRYLRDGRPRSQHREVFLTMKPLAPPFADSTTLCQHVRQYLARAGVQVAHPGMHVFRYSCAQRLLEAEAPLKTIGDYLGHGDPQSTQRYTKIALDQLRDVALGDGEELL